MMMQASYVYFCLRIHQTVCPHLSTPLCSLPFLDSVMKTHIAARNRELPAVAVDPVLPFKQQLASGRTITAASHIWLQPAPSLLLLLLLLLCCPSVQQTKKFTRRPACHPNRLSVFMAAKSADLNKRRRRRRRLSASRCPF